MEQNDFHLGPHANSARKNAAPGGDCEAVRALIPAYSLGATDPDETRLVESLLENCPEAAAELAAYDALAEKLLFSAPPTTAPPHLREKLLASAGSNPAPWRRSAIRARQRVQTGLETYRWSLALAAAVFAIALLVLSNLYWATQIAALQHTQQEITRQLDDHSNVLTLIGAGEAKRIELWNPDRTIRAIMLCNPEEPLGFVYAEDFPPLPQGMVYQLWLIRDQERVSAGTFVVDENGAGKLIFHTNEPIGHYQAAEITSERANAPQPASPVLVRGLLDY